mmetsp:Transcript_18198/g.37936  ORF Transcript_18198/g.37936 Transcript_18198/m.37936 type:complete len:185 (-) Transcript_18198:81-635(-)
MVRLELLDCFILVSVFVVVRSLNTFVLSEKVEADTLEQLQNDSRQDPYTVAQLRRRGSLTIYASIAQKLQSGGGWRTRSHPFMTFTAINEFGSAMQTRTAVLRNNNNPQFNEYKFFPQGSWVKLCAELNNADQPSLQDPLTVLIPQACIESPVSGQWTFVRICAGSFSKTCPSHANYWYFYSKP